MKNGKGGSEDTGDAPIQDSARILAIVEELQASQTEFPIKVEATRTLPYAAVVEKVEPGGVDMVLKLIRPLPPALPAGALFEATLTSGDQRFAGLITFKGRSGHLRYRFSVPVALTLSDRRRHKRYTFRPRENVDVLAQDGGVPGHGIIGSLVNLSEGGLLLRVDRILNLGDGMRVPPGSAFFERGKSLPLIRIRDLPRVPVLNGRGTVAHTEDRGGEILVGIQFSDLSAEDGALLRQVLDLREKMFRSSGGPRGTSEPPPARPEGRGPAAADQDSPGEGPPEATEAERLLTLLARRTRDLVLVAPPGPEAEALLGALQGQGYFRIDRHPGGAAFGSTAAPQDASPRPLLVVLLEAGGGDLAQVRAFQALAGGWAGCPTLFLGREADPIAALAEERGWRVLHLPSPGDTGWLRAVDALAGLD